MHRTHTHSQVWGIVVHPASALILHLARNSTTLAPWQWLLLIEPLPALLFAALFAIVVPNSPLQCGSFLTTDEHAWLMREVEEMQDARKRESTNLTKDGTMPFLEQMSRLLRDPRIVLLNVGGVCLVSAGYGVGLFKTVLLKSGDSGISTATIGAFDFDRSRSAAVVASRALMGPSAARHDTFSPPRHGPQRHGHRRPAARHLVQR